MSDCSCGHSVHDHEADEGCTRCGCPAYKPAATVQRHGMGSGEAIDELCPRCHDKKILHKSGGCMAMDCSCSLTFVPTPPASPTVTLARETVRAYPGVCSGRPLVGGVPLFTIQGRFLAGESISSIAEDFELSVCSVENGLRYALDNDVNEPALALLRAAERQQ